MIDQIKYDKAILPSGHATYGWALKNTKGDVIAFQERGIEGLKLPANQLQITERKAVNHG